MEQPPCNCESGDGLAVLSLTEPDFDPNGVEVVAARSAYWRAHTPIGPAILRDKDVRCLLRDPRLGQGSAVHLARHGITEGPLAEWWKLLILNLEGDRHERQRRLVVKAFRASLVNSLRPTMCRVADEIVGLLCDGKVFDGVTDLADPYTITVLADLLRVPQEQRALLRRWSGDLGLVFSFAVTEEFDKIEAALIGLYECADQLIVARRTRPGDDIVSALLEAREDSQRLDEQELRAIVVTLLFAGHDTSCCQLALALHQFACHPQQWALLRERPQLVDRAVEEVMRTAPATPVIYRLTLTDFSYRDLTVPAGSFLALMVACANTDPDEFGRPGFDIRAQRPRQLTFGGGPHFCLGAALARAEIALALTALARRTPRLELAGTAVFRPPVGIYGPTRLPLRAPDI